MSMRGQSWRKNVKNVMSRVRKTVRTGGALSLVALTLVASMERGAWAYNNREHERWPDQAYQMLNVLNKGAYVTDRVRVLAAKATPPAPVPIPLTQRPPSVPASDQALWDRFIVEAKLAAPKLDQLLVNLPNPIRKTEECGFAYPQLTTGGLLANCRASELTFAPRRKWNENESLCYLRRGYQWGDVDQSRPEIFADVPTRMTGALLGFYAQAVDDEVNDTIMTIRLTNTLFLGAVKGVAEKGVELALTVILAPFVCFAEFFFGGGNCLDDAANAAHDLDPIARIDELIPDGVGQFDGDDLFSTTGLWHFLNVGHSGEFNKVPGMSYMEGGVNGFIDSTDLAIVAAADFGGLTLDPDTSLGPSRYGASADGPKHRRRSDYWSNTIGHVEFEPLDNLALFGWKKFVAEKGAAGLGWPLHAIGDAFAPHHGIAATGWGHRPFEDFAGDVWPAVLHEGNFSHYYDMSAALVEAFRWWRFIDTRQGGNSTVEVPVRELIEALTTETRSSSGANSVLKRDISAAYLVAGSPQMAAAFYGGAEPVVGDLATRALGATVAFLVKAGAFLKPSTVTSPCSCGTGQSSHIAVDLAGQFRNSDTCVTCGTGIFAAMPLLLDGQCVAACPADKPRTQNGTCVATCTGTAPCGGITCPPATPFIQNNVCVAGCSGATTKIVDHRICAASCPTGQVADAAGFCSPPVTSGPKCPSAGTIVDGNGVCCATRARSCLMDADCCSGLCLEDGVCAGLFGEDCSFGSDCLTRVCSATKCGKGSGRARCKGDQDCASNVCQNGSCLGVTGDGCTVGTQCVSTACNIPVNSDPPATEGYCCVGEGNACSNDLHCCAGTCLENGTCHYEQPPR